MPTLVLNLSARKFNTDIVHYEKDHKYFFNQDSQPFLASKKESEVKIKLNRNQKRVLLKTLEIATLATATFLIVSHPTLAASIPVSTGSQSVNMSSIMPESIKQMGVYFLKITTIGGTVLAMILTQFAGGYKMLRKSKEATEWLSDILKGYATVIVAPILIMTIAFLAWLLFSSTPWFISPF